MTLSVEDDGIGLSSQLRPSHTAFGLLGMRERVRAAGGVLSIRSAARQGCTIEVDLPLPAGA